MIGKYKEIFLLLIFLVGCGPSETNEVEDLQKEVRLLNKTQDKPGWEELF